MEKFKSLHGVAAPLPQANVDTDKIIAAKFLKTISRHGLGKGLFSAMRYDDHGVERPGFILNRAPWRNANILVVLDNFGCGSSREHAPWALADFGIRAIVAPSFADIFYNNCFKNGILPITLDRALVDELMGEASDAATAWFSIDLPAQTISRAEGETIGFSIDPDKKNAFLRGIDEIARSEAFIGAIMQFEAAATHCAPPISLDIAAMGQRATISP